MVRDQVSWMPALLPKRACRLRVLPRSDAGHLTSTDKGTFPSTSAVSQPAILLSEKKKFPYLGDSHEFRYRICANTRTDIPSEGKRKEFVFNRDDVMHNLHLLLNVYYALYLTKLSAGCFFHQNILRPYRIISLRTPCQHLGYWNAKHCPSLKNAVYEHLRCHREQRTEVSRSP